MKRSSTVDDYATKGINSKMHFSTRKRQYHLQWVELTSSTASVTGIPVSPTNIFSWYGEMDGREAWHIISLLGVGGNRISFLSQIKMMRHAGMNNFMTIDIHTLTNRKSYGHVGNSFFFRKKWGVSFQLFEKWHLVFCQRYCWCWIKIYNRLLKVTATYTFHPFSKLIILQGHRRPDTIPSLVGSPMY